MLGVFIFLIYCSVKLFERQPNERKNQQIYKFDVYKTGQPHDEQFHIDEYITNLRVRFVDFFD